MIGSLRGTVIDLAGSEALVEVAGVGYRVVVAPRTLAALGGVGTPVFLYVHHHVKEDGQTLYGFLSRDERSTFEVLLGAHRVGPSLALAILAVHTPAALREAVVSSDLAALCLVPGVGKQSATRLLVELRGKLDGLDAAIDLPALERTGNGSAPGRPTSALAEVRAALTGLGYGTDEVRDATTGLADGEPADLLKAALQRLAVRR